MIGFEEASRYAELVRRIFGDVDIVPPGINLEADRPEYEWLKRARLCAGFAVVAASVGNFSIVQLMNPAGSTVLAVVRLIFLSAPVAGGFNVDQTTIAQATLVAGQSQILDARSGLAGGGSVPTCQIRTGIPAAIPGTPIGFFRVLANVSQPIEIPIVLMPGSSVYVRGAAANLAVDGTFYWMERQFDPEELAL